MRPMSMREMHALCYERGIEFDPALVPNELVELAQVNIAHPAWEGRSAAQALHEKRLSERRSRRRVPDWFSPQDVVWEPWEREAALAG
jgi:hypothetical protein